MANAKNKEVIEEQVEDTVDTPEFRTEQIVEIPWEETKDAFLIKKELLDVEQYFASLALSYEKLKNAILSDMANLERSLYSEAEKMRTTSKIDPTLTYELKIPDTPDEKAYFIRKDD